MNNRTEEHEEEDITNAFPLNPLSPLSPFNILTNDYSNDDWSGINDY